MKSKKQLLADLHQAIGENEQAIQHEQYLHELLIAAKKRVKETYEARDRASDAWGARRNKARGSLK